MFSKFICSLILVASVTQASTELKAQLRDHLAFSQKPVKSYNEARSYSLGYLFLEKDSDGYFIQDAYCGEVIRDKTLGPGKIPSFKEMQVDFVWPQSQFSREHSRFVQKVDLFNIYPIQPDLNMSRGNKRFGEVSSGENLCETGAQTIIGKSLVEPRSELKGDIARTLFYFSVRYELPLNAKEEATLRKWHHEDPVSDKERELNLRIFEIQNTRNPFIDFPQYVDYISNF